MERYYIFDVLGCKHGSHVAKNHADAIDIYCQGAEGLRNSVFAIRAADFELFKKQISITK